MPEIPPLKIPTKALPGLKSLAKHGHIYAEALSGLRSEDTASISNLDNYLSKKLSLADEITSEFSSNIMGLHRLRMQLDISPEILYSRLSLGLNTHADWNQEDKTNWSNYKDAILFLLSSTCAYYTLSKSIELAYNYSNVYRKNTIITDIRPIFDEKPSEIRQLVISHTFLIHFIDKTSGDGVEKSIYISLDASDINEIKDSCERAIKKASISHLSLSKMWPTTIVGEQST